MRESDNLVCGYDLYSNTNTRLIFFGTMFVFVISYFFATLKSFDHYSIIDALMQLQNTQFKNEDFPFLIIKYTIIYGAVSSAIFLFIVTYYYKVKHPNWIKLIKPFNSIWIIFISVIMFFIIFWIIMFFLEIPSWFSDGYKQNEILITRIYFYALPFLWSLIILFFYFRSQTESFDNKLANEIRDNLREEILVTNLEQAPDGYGYEILDVLELDGKYKNLTDAKLLLLAYQMGANAILKYDVKQTTITTPGSSIARHHHHIIGTAVKLYKL